LNVTQDSLDSRLRGNERRECRSAREQDRIMPNLHRGEIEAEIGGSKRRLVLTLGALAELEAAFGADDLVALAERFGTGRLKARDLVRIIAAGLRGAGEAVSDDEVARMAVTGGASGYVRIAGALITATFADEGSEAQRPPPPQDARA
jgi:Phage tail tube protein, GTA-gp10